VERNAVGAGMVRRAADYRWSSAASHVTGQDEGGMLDMEMFSHCDPADAAFVSQLINPRSLGSRQRVEDLGFNDHAVGPRFIVTHLEVATLHRKPVVCQDVLDAGPQI